MPTEDIPAKELESRMRVRMAINGPAREWVVTAISNTTFAETLVARTLYLRADDGSREEVSVNPDDLLTRIVEE